MTTWQDLKALIQPRRWFFTRITTTRIIAHIMAVHGVGLLTRAFFDRLTGEGNVTLSIEAIAVLMIAIEIARRMIHIWTHLGVVEWNYYSGTLLRRNIFEHVLALPGAQPLPSSAGEAVSRLRDDTAQIANFTGQSLQRLLSHYVFGIIAAIILLRIHAQIALLVFLPLVAVLTIANMARKRITHYRRESQQAMSNVTGFIGDIFGIVLAIKVAGAEARVADYFRQLNEARRKSTLRARLLDETLLAIFYNSSSVGVGFILLLAGQAMQAPLPWAIFRSLSTTSIS
jgi:ATP-binding cassette subfamily B protein